MSIDPVEFGEVKADVGWLRESVGRIEESVSGIQSAMPTLCDDQKEAIEAQGLRLEKLARQQAVSNTKQVGIIAGIVLVIQSVFWIGRAGLAKAFGL